MSSTPNHSSSDHSVKEMAASKREVEHLEDSSAGDDDEETAIHWRTWLAIFVANLATYSQ